MMQKISVHGLIFSLRLLLLQKNLPKFTNQHQQILWLSLWLFLGGLLRLMHLGSKPPWTDEFATILYSRADDYSSIPLNKIISLETLLAPLKGYPIKGWEDVANLLIHHNNHPPLYFILVNFWQRLFPLDDAGYISIDAVRLLSVIFGTISIWLLYWITKQVFKSEKIAQISAALMAFSPFSIYLSQEARHYTLIILFVLVSLGLSLQVVRQLTEKKALAYPLVFGGIGLSCVGLLIHYFFILTLAGEAIALLWFMVEMKHFPTTKQWFRFGLIVLGVGIFGLIWKTQVLPVSYGSSMTDWIRLDRSNWLDWVNPVFQLFATLVTMVMLLPIEVHFIPLVITFGMVMLVIGWRLIGFWRQGIKAQIQNPEYQPTIFFLSRFIVVIWGLFAILTFGFGIDITRGARYSFAYFPAIILLLAIGISYFWQREDLEFLQIQNIAKNFSHIKSGTKAIAFILIVCFLSSLTVVNNWGYRKYYHPEEIVNQILTTSQPILMVMPHKSTVQIGEMMDIAWEEKRRFITHLTFFAFTPYQQSISSYSDAIEALLATSPFPSVKLWLINFMEPLILKNCSVPERNWITGYYSHVYQCTKNKP